LRIDAAWSVEMPVGLLADGPVGVALRLAGLACVLGCDFGGLRCRLEVLEGSRRRMLFFARSGGGFGRFGACARRRSRISSRGRRRFFGFFCVVFALTCAAFFAAKHLPRFSNHVASSSSCCLSFSCTFGRSEKSQRLKPLLCANSSYVCAVAARSLRLGESLCEVHSALCWIVEVEAGFEVDELSVRIFQRVR
jgi:hypothetical protein